MYELTVKPRVFEDHYEQGELLESEKRLPEEVFCAETLSDVFGQLLKYLGLTKISHFRDGCWSPDSDLEGKYFVYVCVKNSDGEVPTDEEQEKFCKCELNLFNYYYEIVVKETRKLTVREIEQEIGPFGNN